MKFFLPLIKKNLSIAQWFIAAIGGVTLLVGFAATFLLSQREAKNQQNLLFKAYQSQVSILADIASERIRYQNLTSLDLAVTARIRQDPLAIYAYVIDNNGKVLASLDERDIGGSLPDIVKKTQSTAQPLYENDEIATCCENTPRHLAVEDVFLLKGTFSKGIQRAEVGDAAFDLTKEIYFFDERIGTLKLGLSQKPLSQSISSTRGIFVTQAFITMLICLAVISKISLLMIRPLAALTSEIHRLTLLADKGSQAGQDLLENQRPVINKVVPIEVAELQVALYKLKEYLLKSWKVQNEFQKAQESKHLELRRLDALKDEFMANTSHELRTPLNGIVGLTESLLEETNEPLTPTQHEALTSVSLSARRLSNLVNDILDFSSIRYGRLQVNIKPLRMAQLVHEVLDLLSSQAVAKGLILRNMLPQSLPMVLGDEERVVQVLLNLIGNALKFTEFGQIDIQGRVREQLLEITIADTGPGIASESLHVIFNPFEQAPQSAGKRRGKGVGLGLAISRELIRLQGGEIGACSELGKGSKFWFTLPVARIERIERIENLAHTTVTTCSEQATQTENRDSFVNLPVPKSPSDSRTRTVSSDLFRQEFRPLKQIEKVTRNGQKPPAYRHRILAVDDEPINLQLLNKILTRENYEVKIASGGNEALRVFSDFLPDIVLLDMMMPDISGAEICLDLRQRWSLAELPIIFLTARSQAEDMNACFEAGGNDFISKPISRIELLARVKVHLAVRQLFLQQVH